MTSTTSLGPLQSKVRSTTLLRAKAACQAARQFEKGGDYTSAYEALAEFWPDRSSQPDLSELDQSIAGELLLRAGALKGHESSGSLSVATQEAAKDLITRATEIFSTLGDSAKLAEAQGEMALCYWREGAYDEARINLVTALETAGEGDPELKSTLLMRAAIVEVDSQQFDQAVRLYDEARPVVEATGNHGLQGAFHNGYGLLLRKLATTRNREEYIDRALIEYAAASYHFEQAGNVRYVGRVEGNLGYLYFTLGKYKDAHEHLNCARNIFVRLKDLGAVAQVDETRARTLLGQGHPAEAERIIRSAVRVLERTGQQAVLAEALTTNGVALARLGNDGRARATFEQAIRVAEETGDLENAAHARLAIIEELGNRLTAGDLISTYGRAISTLKTSQDPSSGKRLLSSAEVLLAALERLEGPKDDAATIRWQGFSLKKHVKASESAVIERALRDAGGSVSKAAKLLGFKHHQSLISLLNTRHKDLINMRSAARRRRRHIVQSNKKVKARASAATGEA
jgi:tetratricopeptide (TPR) repeat protein